MDRYLLDTHTLLWIHEDVKLLSPTVKQIIENPQNIIFTSIASFWEIIKQNVGKLKLNYSINDLAETCLYNNITISNITLIHLNQLSVLPFLHRDPFDRILIATAYVEQLGFLSKDKIASAYNINVIW